VGCGVDDMFAANIALTTELELFPEAAVISLDVLLNSAVPLI
jgi:hypothetical protein